METKLRFTLIFLGCLIAGCTSLPKIKQPSNIDTTAQAQNYYYCEHCPEITKLEEQSFQPLEPDTPIVQDEPHGVSESISILKRSDKPKQIKNKKYFKKIKHKGFKQCIKWRKL